MRQSLWVVRFHAINAEGEELETGPYSFTTEAKANDFIQAVVADEMKERIAALDDWQQAEVMQDEPTLKEMVERYFAVVDDDSSLMWTMEFDLVDLGDVAEARKIFDFI
jgi:hypothetical protein